MICIELKSFALCALTAFTASYSAPLSAQILDRYDYTQMRGDQIKNIGTRLTDDALLAAFSGKTHYGTYILNSRNEVTATYKETHFANGDVDYSDSSGGASTGSWSAKDGRICYNYTAGSDNAGGCFQIYALEGCYYFFNSGDRYDGYSITRGDDYDQTPQCIPLTG